MVVQKIQFNLIQNKLDDIRIVQGDTCREITFEASDIEGVLSPEDYTYMFQMVKPDHTFIIQTLTDATLKVTEQMGAITGTSYYGIRITDSNDDLIYSGQGAFIVDDHVISDSDIESVAEVNGYVFPDDFATTEQIESVVESLGFAKIADNHQNLTETWSSEKIADYASVMAEGLITDNQIAEDHTWSSNKINTELTGKAVIDDETVNSQDTWSSAKIADELSNIEFLDIYTTSEKIVGKWIDNKDLYEKTLTGSFNNTSTARTWHDILSASEVSDLDIETFFISSGSFVKDPDGDIYTVPQTTGVSTGSAVGAIISGGKLQMVIEGLGSGTVQYTLTIRYTKSS